MPLVERHHLILVTLLIVDAGAAEALPIFLDRISSPVIAIVISVTAVLFFGEILPSAVCSKWGLAIGANMVIRFFFPFSADLTDWGLDCAWWLYLALHPSDLARVRRGLCGSSLR
jgi:CBS domain containing-hemolysin-like protein